MAFSVDATFRSIANSIPDTLVIAHQDSLDHWEHQPDDIIADWRGEKLTTNSTLIENGEKTVRSMALLPILKNYINKEANTSCQNIFQYVQTYHELDHLNVVVSKLEQKDLLKSFKTWI